jgi:hypothetical protein
MLKKLGSFYFFCLNLPPLKEFDLKDYSKYRIVMLLLLLSCLMAYGQRKKLQSQPYADQKMFHLGFTVGMNAQDLILSHTGAADALGDVWFAEIPSYSPGFSVGIIADKYLNHYMNLRAIPSLHFGGKRFTYREQDAPDASNNYNFSLKTNYLALPVHVRFSSERLNNIRPYVLAGGFVNYEIGAKNEPEIKFKKMDYGIEIGLGCNLYFPLFKLSPELRFSFGLRDLIEHGRSDIRDPDMLKFTDALKSGKSRMITLTFNFE